MRDVVLLALGAVAGVGATELYSLARTRLRTIRARRFLDAAVTRDDATRHARNIVSSFASRGRASDLYVTGSTKQPQTLPVLADETDRFVGPIVVDSDWPLLLSRGRRHELGVDPRIVSRAERRGVHLWDGTIVRARGWDARARRLSADTCNFLSYVTLGEQVLRESDTASGHQPFLSAVDLDVALESRLGPTVVAAATTCIFTTSSSSVTVLHRRSSSVVTARGMYAVTPAHGIEPHFWGTEISRYGVVLYNVLREVLEELFGVEEIRRNNDSPRSPHPDWIFSTREGAELVAELDAGRLALRCEGACVDLSDGSLVLALTATFDDPGFLERLKLGARGSDEAMRVDGEQLRFVGLHSPELDQLMTTERMTATSIFCLDRARLRSSMPGPGEPPHAGSRSAPDPLVPPEDDARR